MTNYPIKVRWVGDSRQKWVSRDIEPLLDTPEDKRPMWDTGELKTLLQISNRQKTNLVIENDNEKELVIKSLKNFRDGIGHYNYGAFWASMNKYKCINRVIGDIQSA